MREIGRRAEVGALVGRDVDFAVAVHARSGPYDIRVGQGNPHIGERADRRPVRGRDGGQSPGTTEII